MDTMITYFRERIAPPALITKEEKEDRDYHRSRLENGEAQPTPVPVSNGDPESLEEEPQVPLPFEDPQQAPAEEHQNGAENNG